MFKSSGQLKIHSDWWLVIHVDEGLGEYYRSVFNNVGKFSNIKINKPKWGTHISVIRNEYPKYPLFLQKYHDTMIEFEYSPKIKTNGLHVWMDVSCKEALDIREELGLSRKGLCSLHLSFGTYLREGEEDQTRVFIPKILE